MVPKQRQGNKYNNNNNSNNSTSQQIANRSLLSLAQDKVSDESLEVWCVHSARACKKLTEAT